MYAKLLHREKDTLNERLGELNTFGSRYPCDRYPKNKPLADQKEKSLALSSRCFRAEVHHTQWLMELGQQMAHSPISVYRLNR